MTWAKLLASTAYTLLAPAWAQNRDKIPARKTEEETKQSKIKDKMRQKSIQAIQAENIGCVIIGALTVERLGNWLFD